MALSGTKTQVFSLTNALYLKITWSATQSQAGNYSDVTVNYYYGKSTSGSATTGGTISGTLVDISNSKAIDFSFGGATEHLMFTLTKRINHNSNGYASFAISEYGSIGSGNTASIDQTYSLNRITPDTPPPTVIATNELYDIGQDYVYVRYVTYATASNPQIRLWESGAFGEWRTAVGNPVLLNRKGDNNYLDPSTNYAIQMRLQNASGTWVECNDLWFNTLASNSITSSINLTLGNNLLINLYNPKAYSTTLNVKDKNGTLVASRTGITGTTYTLVLTAEEVTAFQNAMPNDNYVNYTIDVLTYNGASVLLGTITATGIVTITDANPTFTTFTYVDTNTVTKAITKLDTTMIKGYSNAKLTIISDNKAVANKSATMVSYSLESQGLTPIPKTYSADSTVEDTLNGILYNNLVVKAIDSRGNQTPVTYSPILIDYSIPIITSASIMRTDNVEAETTLSFSGTYTDWASTYTDVANSIQEAKYRYSSDNGTTWSEYIPVTLATNTAGNYTFSDTIDGDLEAHGGFTANTAFIVELVITDKLASITLPVPLVLNSAQPLWWAWKDVVGGVLKAILGIGKKPDTSLPHGSVDILGDLVVGGKKLIDLTYPVGAIYMSVVSTSPATLFGGTWSVWGTGRVPVGVDTSQTEFSTVEKTGGHKLLHSHNHNVRAIKDVINTDSGGGGIKASNAQGNNYGYTGWNNGDISTTGGGDSQNLQPYITCYMWKRTA